MSLDLRIEYLPLGQLTENTLTHSPRPVGMAVLNELELLRTAQLHHVEATQRVRVSAGVALSSKRRLEPDKIRSRANVLGGHGVGLGRTEQSVKCRLVWIVWTSQLR